ncbi:MAG TPA: TolC family protein [Vicinamibacteria bacterium]|nr:TolC family protein [Vicinamibacteria bacterium]
MPPLRALMCLTSLLAASSSLGQEPELPPPPPEEEVVAEGPEPGARTLTLAEAVELAVRKNFGLLDQADSVQASHWNENTAEAQFRPRLTPRYQASDDQSLFALDASQRLPWLGGSLTGTAAYRSIDQVGPSPAGSSTDFRLALSQPLLRGFGPNTTYYDLRNARRARQRQERAFEVQRQVVAVTVARAYYAVVRQRALMGVSRQSLRRTRGLREASEARMQVGLASKLDVFRAELQASQTEDALVQAQATLEESKEAFRALLGMAPSEPVEPEASTLPEAEIELAPLAELIRTALEHRLEVQEARDQIDDARRTASLAKQNLLPQLDLTVAVSRLGFGAGLGDSIDQGDTQVNVFLSTSYPLERSADRANKAISELEVEAQRRALTQREQDVEGEVRSAVRNIERIQKSVELQRKNVTLAEQQLRLATLRYQRGLASNFDVVDAEGNLVTARSLLVGLLTDFQVARVQLLRVLGTLDLAAEFAP